MASNVARQRRERRRRRLGRVTVIRRALPDRENPLEYLSESEVFARFRFRPATIIYLTGLLVNALTRPTLRSSPLTPLVQVLAALRFYATGTFYLVVGDTLHISISSVCRAVSAVSSCLLRLRDHFIRFPSDDHERAKAKQEFYALAGFPNVLGAVDGTMIKIMRPKDNDIDFLNRKGYHSLNVQMSCSAKFEITSCSAKWPGSVHDSRVFRDSHLNEEFENGTQNGILLGDSAYALKKYVMTPFPVPSTPEQIRYNKCHARTRVVIEQTYGILKRRFPCLQVGLRVKPSCACKHTVNCVILHNLGIQRGDIFQFDDDIYDEDMGEHAMPVYANPDDAAGSSVRNFIAREYFST